MSNYCACSGGDEEYTIELNQQGPEGPQGPVGPEGFSPEISINTNTDAAYILTITNKEGSFNTPNLYGELEKLNVNLTNLPNPVTFNGVTLLSSDDSNAAVLIDGAKITTDDNDNLMLSTTSFNKEGTEEFSYEVVLNPLEQRLELHDNEGTVKVVAVTDEIAIVQSQLSDKLDRATYEADKATYATKEELASTDATVASIQTSLDSKLESSNIIAGANVTIDRSGNNLTISSTGGGGGGSGDVTAAGNNRFTGDNTFIGKVNIAGGALTVDGLATLNQASAQYLNAVSITSPGEINATSIKANGLRSDDIQTTENKKYLTEVDVDNQTIQIVNGKLHANIDELGNEVNDLSDRVTTLQTSKQDTLTAGANITIVDNVISAIGGGSGGSSIDDSSITTVSTWSSSKINSEITTSVDTINSTKNDNIFDISKFQVVGNPTITYDGIASGFSSSKYLNTGYILNPEGDWSVRVKFRTGESMANQHIVAAFPNQYSGLVIQLRKFSATETAIRATIANGSDSYILQVNSDNIVDKINTDFDVELNYLSGVYSFIINGVTVKTLTSSDKMVSTGEIVIGKSPQWNEPFLGSVYLKDFSITVGGKQVFNGLMESTKPIYDKLTTTSTALSTFQTATDNNFSAVNSALNEKANLSDLAGYVTVTKYNELLARVVALETEINGGNA